MSKARAKPPKVDQKTLQQQIAEEGSQARRRSVFVVEILAVVRIFEFRGDHPAAANGEPFRRPAGRGPVRPDDEGEIGIRRGREAQEQDRDEKRSDQVHA